MNRSWWCFVLAAPAPAIAQPSAPRVQLVEELRLDANTEDFPAVSRLSVGPRGHIVVPISADMQLRIYSGSGHKVATIGRRGSGPGEFQSFAALGWLADTMWVADIRQYRTTYIAPDFTVLRSVVWPQSPTRLPTGEQIGYFFPAALLRDGAAVGEALLFPTGERERVLGSATILRSGDGTATMLQRRPPDEEAPWLMVASGLGQTVPFALQPQRAYDAHRFGELSAPIPARAEGTFSVVVRTVEGDTVFARSYPFRGRPIPQSAKDSAVAAFERRGRPTEGPSSVAAQHQRMARERMSSWFIPAETILLGLDRTVWIGMRPTEQGRGYLILNAAGDAVGSVLVPPSMRIRQASATHVWVTETDDDGLSSVVRYRLAGLNCGQAGC